MLPLDLCDYSDAYIAVKETFVVANTNNNLYEFKFFNRSNI